MTTSNESEAKRPLKLNRPGKLQLKKTVETGQVRQSFSHGRSKAVTVEVKRSRTFERGTSGRMTEVTEAGGEAEAVLGETAAPAAPPEFEERSGRRLSAEERASRARALEIAREEEASRREREAEEAKLRAEQAKRAAEERALREAEEAEARERAAEVAASAPAAAPQAPREAPRETGEAPAATPASAKERARPAAKAPGGTAEEEDEDSPARAKLRKGPAAAPKAPARSRGEPRRRAGKLTINQALDGQEGRQRSLAAMKRQREKQ